MPFMVIYDRADGTSGHEEATAIDEAALFVERLRNDESVDKIRLFRMEEIAFAFRPYYKVELGLPPRMAPAEGLAHASESGIARRAAAAGATVADGLVDGPAMSGASGLFRR